MLAELFGRTLLLKSQSVADWWIIRIDVWILEVLLHYFLWNFILFFYIYIRWSKKCRYILLIKVVSKLFYLKSGNTTSHFWNWNSRGISIISIAVQQFTLRHILHTTGKRWGLSFSSKTEIASQSKPRTAFTWKFKLIRIHL